MKLALFILSVLISTITQAQTTPPQKLNYQAVARNAAGTTIANQNIGVKIEVLDADQTTVVYAETHTVTTNQFGLFTLQIGGGTATLGSFAGINWGSGNKFQKTSVDLTGGTNYQLMGITQFMSVPYALYAGSVANNGGKNTVILTDTVSNAGAQKIIAEEVGPNTQVLRIMDCTKLTSVNLPEITNLTELNISYNTQLTTVNLPNVKSCMGNFAIINNPRLINLDLSKIEKIGEGHNRGSLTGFGIYEFLQITDNGFTSLTFPSLKYIASDSKINYNLNLTSLSFPSLVSIVGGTYPDSYGNSWKHEIFGSSLSSISFPVLKSINGGINISSAVKITSLSFPQLIKVDYLSLYNCDALTLPNATTISSLIFVKPTNANPNFSSNLTSLDLPALKVLGRIILDSTGLTSLNFPSLKKIVDFSIDNNKLLSSINMPVLDSITSTRATQAISIERNEMLSLVSMPMLKFLNTKANITNNAILSTVDLPLMASVENDFELANNPLLNTLNMGNFTSFKGSKLSLNNNKLPTSKVNSLLGQLVAMSPTLTQKNILLKQLPPAPPSGQGIADKSTLISNGNTVATD